MSVKQVWVLVSQLETHLGMESLDENLGCASDLGLFFTGPIFFGGIDTLGGNALQQSFGNIYSEP